jgi:biopolymer transport protein ExbB
MDASPSAEAAVVSAGLLEADRGPKAAEEAMQGAAALQRIKLERRLAFLGTLGNNAPFIGLFGTVIGVVQAFEALGKQNVAAGVAAAPTMAPQEVMSAIAEALVATAVGLAVAIPAVAMYNVFQRKAKAILANTEALSRVLLAHLVAPQLAVAAPAQAGRSSQGRAADDDDEDEDED